MATPGGVTGGHLIRMPGRHGWERASARNGWVFAMLPGISQEDRGPRRPFKELSSGKPLSRMGEPRTWMVLGSWKQAGHPRPVQREART